MGDKGGIPFPSSFLVVLKWCAEVLKAKTLISYYILLKEAMNTKIDGIIH